MNFESLDSTPERVVASAIRFQGRIFRGKTHSEAIDKMEEDFPGWDEYNGSPEDGFLTNTGRFVQRDEAGEIAKNARQLEHLDSRTREDASDSLDAHHIEELRPKWLE